MDMIFKALADPARRTLLNALHQRDGQSLQELTELLEMTRFGVMKHLGVLIEARLIVTRKDGRFKYHYLNAVPLQEAIDRWIEPLLVQPAARAVISLKTQLEGTTPMSKPDFMMQTYIHCTQDALWHALTDADANAAYNFVVSSCEREGNALIYKTPDDNTMLICTETQLTPKTRIESTFEPHWAGPEVPLQASRFVYIIEPQVDHCLLTLEHYDLPAGQEGIADGWQRTLAGLKTWLETGKTVKFSYPAAEA
ncbi:ArsR family transcriptional regulator [Sulfitobacter sp. SK012]|uniref:ArsR/SmtB family transcription factor n=1 Tax=Sulfitobacter sp. SK012 TaxID=1389005 RepID=UPI000E0C5CD2|nr:metalloregulator ArsR/SmtB family transcription factor [Sulfitobacter sp. SK012]AXI47428.1 ArsR family transcriptional regulator [Sulfitobacter sp. SK012]